MLLIHEPALILSVASTRLRRRRSWYWSVQARQRHPHFLAIPSSKWLLFSIIQMKSTLSAFTPFSYSTALNVAVCLVLSWPACMVPLRLFRSDRHVRRLPLSWQEFWMPQNFAGAQEVIIVTHRCVTSDMHMATEGINLRESRLLHLSDILGHRDLSNPTMTSAARADMAKLWQEHLFDKIHSSTSDTIGAWAGHPPHMFCTECMEKQMFSIAHLLKAGHFLLLVGKTVTWIKCLESLPRSCGV